MTISHVLVMMKEIISNWLWFFSFDFMQRQALLTPLVASSSLLVFSVSHSRLLSFPSICFSFCFVLFFFCWKRLISQSHFAVRHQSKTHIYVLCTEYRLIEEETISTNSGFAVLYSLLFRYRYFFLLLLFIFSIFPTPHSLSSLPCTNCLVVFFLSLPLHPSLCVSHVQQG